MQADLEKMTREREEAWEGDAVLALYVRRWILQEKGVLDGEMFVRFTSNEFLKVKGNPTSVEAHIGRIYRETGLQAGFDWIEEHLLPHFLLREKNLEMLRLKQGKGRKTKKRG